MGGQRDTGGQDIQGRRRARAYRRGWRARALKQAGRLWLEPHYPAHDAQLALSWLDGWCDKDAQIQAGA